MKLYELVDDLLDSWEVTDPGFDSFTAVDVASWMGCSVPRASNLLQQHRSAQKRGKTTWTAACRGYARTAVWYVLGGPGRATGGAERLTAGHAAHIANDLHRRAMSDLATELDPAALTHPAIQALMGGFGKQIEATTTGLVDAVNVTLDLIEQTTGLVPDRRGVA